MDLGIGLPTSGRSASPEAIAHVAQGAERIGLASVWTFERLLRPTRPIPMGGSGPTMPAPDAWATVYDPLETLNYVAATTSTIALGTSALDTLFYPPVILARRIATLDRLSGGRALIGLGQGWMAQEFIAAGVPWSRRGAGFEEHLEAMRTVWGPDPVQFDGRFYQIPESEIGPKPVRSGGPRLLVGATAPVALERGARMGLGLVTVLFSWDALRATVATFRQAAEAGGRDPASVPVVVQVNGVVSTDPAAACGRVPLTGPIRVVVDDLAELRSLGVEHVFWDMGETDPDTQLDALAELRSQA